MTKRSEILRTAGNIATAAMIGVMAVGLGVAGAMLAVSEAYPHQATPTASQPLGWAYGWECCNLMDCREVPDSAVEEGPKGYVIKATGEVIPYSDKKIKQSKDERFHWCSKGGKPDTDTICLYVPNRGF